ELIDKYFKPTNLSPDIHKSSIIDFESIDKAVKKTEQYIKVNAYKAEKKIDKLIGNNQPATTNKAPQVSSLITSNADEARQIIESIDDVTQKHVINIDKVTYNKKKERYEFTGGHTINAAENFINLKNKNPNTTGYSYTYTDIVHENGVISRKITITDNNGNMITKRGNNGYSSLYPASWSQEKINQEVKSALENIIHVNKKYNIYTGISNEKIKIQFIIIDNTIISHYPLAN
ncbi:MAG: EndoU domain-containing protein, partial [Flavobacteriales bacterium]|nr:EndoU domain-containing protein [Flavobacteriales bacterium]